MNLIKTFLEKTKNQPMDIWFFFLFLLSFTLSVRKVALYFPIEGTFSEYTGIYVYISDIFLFLAIGSWLILLSYNLFYKLSNSNYSSFRQVIHSLYGKIVNNLKVVVKNVSRGTFFGNVSIILLILVIWAFVSIIWSDNKSIALFRSIKLLEYYGLLLYVVYRFIPCIVPRGTQNMADFTFREESAQLGGVKDSLDLAANGNKNVPRGTSNPPLLNKERSGVRSCSTWNIFLAIIIFVASVHAVIAISQFFDQSSLGLYFLKESFLSSDTPGVAKVIFSGDKYIRAYGLFPHPNILGGFLLFSIVLTVCRLRLFHVEHCSNNIRKGVNSQKSLKFNHFLNEKLGLKVIWLIQASLILQTIALILTFSKSAMLGLVIASGYIVYKIVPLASPAGRRGTQSTSSPLKGEGRGVRFQMFHLPHRQAGVKHFRRLMLVVLILLFSFIVAKPNWNAFFVQSLSERKLYLNVSRGTILANPVLGVGMGQFVLSMPNYSTSQLASWQFQPVHNIFLLIFAELGLVGLAIVFYFLLKMWKLGFFESVDRKNENCIIKHKNVEMSNEVYLTHFKGIFLGLMFIGLFDHYLWDIQQGTLLLFMVFGFIIGLSSMCESQK